MTIIYKCRVPVTFGIRTYSKTNKLYNLLNPTILGIETSCDDTGCAVIDGSGKILSETLYSQNAIHIKYGGVNPLVANELHRQNIKTAVKEALEKADKTIKDIDAIAVTTKPGLLVSLKVGVKYARYLARMHNKPIIPVHHMEAHALVARMYHEIYFPFLVLLISGGHCLLAVVKDVEEFILLGKGLDNAPGEVFDKVARRMKLKNLLEYSKISGGQAVEIAASKTTNPEMFKFPLPLLKYRDCNFSFSGLKDSLERKLIHKEKEHQIRGCELIPEVNDLCAAFQLTVAEHLAHRTKRAIMFCEKKRFMPHDKKTVVVSGGVACNNFIFKSIEFMANKLGYNVVRPPPPVCTDNGVMIAWNGLEKIRKQCDMMSDIGLKDIEPTAPLGKNIINEVTAANIQVKITRLKKLYTTYSIVLIFLSYFLIM